MSKHFLTITKTLFVCLLVSMFSVGNANTTDVIQLTSSAELEVVTQDDQGNEIIKRVPAEKVIPGSEVIYTTHFKYNGSQPAENIAISNPIPEHTVYKLGSAAGQNTQILFSANGGESFHAAQQLQVSTQDGSQRSAEASDYTNIRWTYQGQLQPGDEGVVEFRVVLK